MPGQISKHQAQLYQVKEVPGGVGLEVRLDLLPPPSESYFSDCFRARLESRTCSFLFGKLSASGERLRTLLEVVMPLGQMPVLARMVGGDFLSGLNRFLEATKSPVARSVPDGAPAEKEHAVAANFAMLGYSDFDAAISLYRVPPTFSLRLLNKDRHDDLRDLRIDGVVRIDTLAPVLMAFCQAIEKFAADARASGIHGE